MSLQVCPVREESRLLSATVTGSCELPRWFSSGHEGPLMTECRGVPAQAAFLPAFQAGMHGLFSARSYLQIIWLPLLCNCKAIFLEVLCFSTCSFSQNVLFLSISQKIITLWACDAMCSIDSLVSESIMRKNQHRCLFHSIAVLKCTFAFVS